MARQTHTAAIQRNISQSIPVVQITIPTPLLQPSSSSPGNRTNAVIRPIPTLNDPSSLRNGAFLTSAATSNRPHATKQSGVSISFVSPICTRPIGMLEEIPSWMTCSGGSMERSNARSSEFTRRTRQETISLMFRCAINKPERVKIRTRKIRDTSPQIYKFVGRGLVLILYPSHLLPRVFILTVIYSGVHGHPHSCCLRPQTLKHR